MKIPLKPHILIFFVAALAFVASAQALQDSDPILKSPAAYTLLPAAVEAGIEGSVTVALNVDQNGVPTKAELLSQPMWPCSSMPSQALDELSAMLTAEMMKLRFTPATHNGKPIAKEITLSVDLKNPKVEPAANIDPTTGKVKPETGGVINGKATSLPKPTYPKEAKKKHVKGSVTVSVLIDEKGSVLSGGAIEGPLMLQSVARDAACKATFTPTLFNGRPVKVMAVITYNFTP